MKKNWFQRNPNLTMILCYGGIILSVERTLSEHFPENELTITLTIVCAATFLMMWLLMLKGRSFWWLFLVVPVPVAYFFLKNNLELPKNIKV